MIRILLSLVGVFTLYVGALAFVDTGRMGVMLAGLAAVLVAYRMKGPR